MWLSKAGEVLGTATAGLAKAGTGLTSTGSRALEFVRADYPDTFPRQGFVAAVALLPSKTPGGDVS
jgi:hypothetical protein